MDQVNVALGISDDVIEEQFYLIARGVRPMALLGSIPTEGDLMLQVSTRIETLAEGTVTPFVVDRGDGLADVGYAAAPWVVDLFRWTFRYAADPQLSRVVGLLLGYSAQAIADFESHQGRRWFTESPGR